jgi:hypothetical protein
MSKTRFILKIKKNQTRQVTWQRNISAVRPGVMFVLPPEIVASEPAYAYATGLINTNRYGFRAPPPPSRRFWNLRTGTINTRGGGRPGAHSLPDLWMDNISYASSSSSSPPTFELNAGKKQK